MELTTSQALDGLDALDALDGLNLFTNNGHHYNIVNSP